MGVFMSRNSTYSSEQYFADKKERISNSNHPRVEAVIEQHIQGNNVDAFIAMTLLARNMEDELKKLLDFKNALNKDSIP